jgi:hypothetical protein
MSLALNSFTAYRATAFRYGPEIVFVEEELEK